MGLAINILFIKYIHLFADVTLHYHNNFTKKVSFIKWWPSLHCLASLCTALPHLKTGFLFLLFFSPFSFLSFGTTQISQRSVCNLVNCESNMNECYLKCSLFNDISLILSSFVRYSIADFLYQSIFQSSDRLLSPPSILTLYHISQESTVKIFYQHLSKISI